MIDVNYAVNDIGLGHESSYYKPVSKTIVLRFDTGVFNKLTNKEQLEVISDTITHEFMHFLIENKLNLDPDTADFLSMMFDAISHNFLNYDLEKKYLKLRGFKYIGNYKEFIERKGLIAFLNFYNISTKRYNKHMNNKEVI